MWWRTWVATFQLRASRYGFRRRGSNHRRRTQPRRRVAYPGRARRSPCRHHRGVRRRRRQSVHRVGGRVERRLAISANSTRSTSVVNLRAPSTCCRAASTPSWLHKPSSRCTLPIGRDPATLSRYGGRRRRQRPEAADRPRHSARSVAGLNLGSWPSATTSSSPGEPDAGLGSCRGWHGSRMGCQVHRLESDSRRRPHG